MRQMRRCRSPSSRRRYSRARIALSQRTDQRAHAGDLAVEGVDHFVLAAHPLGDHAIFFVLTVLPAIAHGDDRLDLMLLPQPVDISLWSS